MAGLSSFFGPDRRPPAVDVDHARDHTQDPVPHPPARRAAARASRHRGLPPGDSVSHTTAATTVFGALTGSAHRRDDARA